MTIVMGLDQHRAQITAEWIDSVTGEIGRARVVPAHREGVRRFLERFAGQDLEVALEATTGWRFVVEELRSVGAGVHLGEPAQTSALRGNKKRPKTDRGDARHLRELLMVGRLPESWVPPDHLLDLRSKVRLRHTLVDQRGEWQQRIRAVLYHHGLPHRRELHLLGSEGRAWLEVVELPDAAREQIAVAIAVSETLDAQIAPLDRALRLYARRQPGCRALMAHYGIGELTSVAILAERRRLPAVLLLAPGGPLRRDGHHRASIRSASQPWASFPPRPARFAMGALRGSASRSPPDQPGSRLLRPGRRATRRQPRMRRDHAQAVAARLPHVARARRGGAPACMTSSLRAKALTSQMRRGLLPRCRCRHAPVDGLPRLSGRNASPSGNHTPSPSCRRPLSGRAPR